MNDLDTAAQLAFQATTAVQQWCITVMTAVDSQLEQSGNVSTAKLRPLGGWLGGWPGLDLPAWVGLGVAAKSTIWGATAAPPAQGGYFLISFRSGDGKPWQLQVKWGRFKDVHRPRGKFKVLDIYRELLDLVNHEGQEFAWNRRSFIGPAVGRGSGRRVGQAPSLMEAPAS